MNDIVFLSRGLENYKIVLQQQMTGKNTTILPVIYVNCQSYKFYQCCFV